MMFGRLEEGILNTRFSRNNDYAHSPYSNAPCPSSSADLTYSSYLTLLHIDILTFNKRLFKALDLPT